MAIMMNLIVSGHDISRIAINICYEISAQCQKNPLIYDLHQAT